MRLLLLTILVVSLTVSAAAQARRVAPATSATGQAKSVDNDRPVKEMFDEVGAYLRVKAAEFDAKKTRLSDSGLAQLRLEQRQLAARYATMTQQRTILAGEDFYYLGMLHWIAENYDRTRETLEKFIAVEGSTPERVQTARSVLVVALAKKKELKEAEKVLAAYAKGEPRKLTERSRMASELARAYQRDKDYAAMTSHAAEAYSSAKTLLTDATSYARGLDEILDAGLLLVESQRETMKTDEALATLDDMATAAIRAQSPSFYYYVVDNRVRYLVDLSRKSDAIAHYRSAITTADKAFVSKPQRDDALRRLKAREKHYALLGTKAPAMPAFDQWFPGAVRTLDQMKGKVVMLDFWATWCTPCLEAFPAIREWNEEFKDDGLEIVGITRYYGTVAGMPADKARELGHLKRFRQMYRLPYDFVVMDNQSMQLTYGATALPTAVLIDRKGVVRFIETGTSMARLVDLRATIERLINEK